MKNKIIQFSFYLGGIFTLSLGVTLTLLSNLGAGGWDALTANIAKLIGIQVGTGTFILGIILIIFTSILEKKKPNLYALLVSYITGIFINFWYYDIFKQIQLTNFYLRFIIVILGVIIIGIGCAMIFVTNCPKNHTETFIFAVATKLKIMYRTSKVSMDTIALIIGVILGFILKDLKNIGIGTLLNTFCTGYIIHYVLPVVDKVYKVLKEMSN